MQKQIHPYPKEEHAGRIAYLISAYKDAPHLARLIDALDGNADFYVHIDLRVDAHPFEKLLSGKVMFVPRYWISWGGWEQVAYQKELLGAALGSGIHYSRLVCLSGQDYPLWSNERIHRFFSEHREQEHIMGMNLTHSGDQGLLSKVTVWHFFRDLRWRNLWTKSKLIVVSRLLMKCLPFRKRSTTVLEGRPADVFFGSDYWAVTPACARYIYEHLCTEAKLTAYFKTSFAPSEQCIQTIVFNSPFACRALLYESAYPGLPGLTPLHYIVYGKSIKVMTIEDLPNLIKSGKMFCRKVVSGESDELVEAVDRMRKEEEENS